MLAVQGLGKGQAPTGPVHACLCPPSSGAPSGSSLGQTEAVCLAPAWTQVLGGFS